jgi:small-conductance mechanosensitive channel
MVEKAIKIGDYVKLESGLEGHIEDVTWRTTRIKTPQNNIIIIPNEKLVQAIVTNYDLQDKKVAVVMQVGVSYNSDIEKVEKILLEIGKNAVATLNEAADDEPLVRFNPGFTDSSLVFTLILFSKEFAGQFIIQSEVRKAIFKRFKAENIEIPFPQMDVHIKDNHL